MKALIFTLVAIVGSLAHAKVSCTFSTAGLVNGVPTVTQKPLKVFADSNEVNALFITEGDFFADYNRVPQLDVERMSITYKTAAFLRVEANAGFDKKGIARLELLGDSKDRPNAFLTCKKD